MNKSAIQKYAIWARNELRDQIAKRGYYFGIDADGINVDGKDETCVYARDGRLLTDTERKQRNELFRLVIEKGFDQVVEEVSYTWFNRLIALRFMEVNDYLPEHIRVLSNANNEFKPEIKTRALDLEDPHFDKKKILDLIDRNDDEELYRYLLLTECNALNDLLPQMFEKIGGYTELLLPKNLLKADSIIGKLVSDIDEADWDVKSEGGQVQIIGWLYQYYNQELKDLTFNDLKKKNKKISKERIPAATQLFTPDWIVHYMVENSLGRMWIEGHPNDELKSTWKYYLDEADQEPQVEEQLKEIRKEYSKLNPQDIKFLDPAMGSGHILVVAFDILMQIYESQGIRPREAAKSILENNLYGLDIDDRAAQLAYFAVMMKAREYDRRIFSRGVQPNLYSIQESNGIDDSLIDYVANGDKKIHSDLKTLVKEMKDGKEYGSIISVSELDFNRLEEKLEEQRSNTNLLGIGAIEKISQLVKVGRLLAQKYEIVCTNPPYMNSSNMGASLTKLLKSQFKDSKTDFFAAFIERAMRSVKKNGFVSLITMESWMFLKSFEDLRLKILSASTIVDLMHMPYLGKGGTSLGINFGTVAFVIRNHVQPEYVSHNQYIPYYQCSAEGCPLSFPTINDRYSLKRQSEYLYIPGYPISYWIDDNTINGFKQNKISTKYIPKFGMSCGDGERYIRLWYEVNNENILFNAASRSEIANSKESWIPLDKGGEFRKWYGNNNHIVFWKNDGYEIRNNGKSAVRSPEYFGRPHISWTLMSTKGFSARYFANGFILDTASNCLYFDNEEDKWILGYLNTGVCKHYLSILNPTINFSCGVIGNLPLPILSDNEIEFVNNIVDSNVYFSKRIWDSGEISWEFKRNPIIPINAGESSRIQDSLEKWVSEFSMMKESIDTNEDELNEFFAQKFKLEDIVHKNKYDSERTHIPTNTELVKELISYAVGVIMGRYSIDEEGLQFAGGNWINLTRQKITADEDNIVPIGDNEYFNDDLSSLFVSFIQAVYGPDYLEDNLQFIANTLGGIGSSRDIIRKYFLNDFFSDHCQMYKKRPIYWLFDSGKKNGFKCLIYLHRYCPDTLARIRTDYVLEQQERYRSQIKHINETINEVPKSEQMKMKKQLKDLEGKLAEVTKYEEKIHHLADQMIEIDLDDGVKHNYALFQDVLAKIK